jgi:hypothetical protein
MEKATSCPRKSTSSKLHTSFVLISMALTIQGALRWGQMQRRDLYGCRRGKPEQLSGLADGPRACKLRQS